MNTTLPWLGMQVREAISLQNQRLYTPLSVAIDTFLQVMHATNELSTNTLRHYYHDLQLFTRFLSTTYGQTVPVGEIDPFDVDAFLHEQARRGNSLSSQKRRLAALRRFFEAMEKWGYTDRDPTEDVPGRIVPPNRPTTLTLDEALRFLEASKGTRYPSRDYAIFYLFLVLGCTLSELLRLRRSDVSLSAQTVRIWGRGGVTRTLPLSDRSCKVLAAYLKTRPKAPADSTALFLNRRGDRITKGAVYHAFGLILPKAGIAKERITIHSLRHTCFALLWQAGVSLRVMQRLAGHQSLASTRIYEWAGERPPTPRRWMGVHPLEEALEDAPVIPLE